RFAAEARGWLAYLQLHDGDRAGALAAYYHMIAQPDVESRSIGLASLHVERQRASVAEMQRVEAILEGDRAAALAYAYYELYNFAPWSGYDWVYGDSGDQDIAKLKRGDEFIRVAAFATRLASRGQTSGAFLLRAAMADLELGRDEDASRLAHRAL